MRNIYFTVGPSQIFPTVAKHAKSALREDIFSLSHRGKEFSDLYKSISINLKKLLSIPDDYHLFFLSSGTEGMERVIQNCVEHKSFHFIEGKFGDKFFAMAKELGKDALMVGQKGLTGFDFKNIKIPKGVEMLCFTQNDTSTGMQIPMSEIYKICKKHPDLLVSIDTVSSVPYVDIDYTKIDCVFFSVQKGFGLPAGLGVMVVSPRAVEKASRLAKKGINIGTYHSLLTLREHESKFQTPETPNVFAIYLLNKVLQDFLKIGIKKLRSDTEKKAMYMYDFFKKNQQFHPLIKNKHLRSQTTLVIEVSQGSKNLIQSLASKGLIVGSGYGEFKDKHIRIANFPAHRLKDIKNLVKAIKESV